MANFLEMEEITMNRRPSGSLSLTKAIQGFIRFKGAEGLSDWTIDSYQRQLAKWAEYMGDWEIFPNQPVPYFLAKCAIFHDNRLSISALKPSEVSRRL